MKISIVTPSYNQGKFLKETIESVLNQEIQPLEYIIIDGGSTDESVSIIKEYEDKLAYWVSEKDSGQTNAINKGLQRITGEVWGYLCSDDTLLPGVLDDISHIFSENKEVDIVYGNCLWVDEKGKRLKVKIPNHPFDRLKLLKNNFIYQPSVFMRKRVLEEIGPFNESLDYGMDYEYWLRASEKFNFKYVDINVSTYRLHFDSKSIKHVKAMRKEMIKIKKPYGYESHAIREYQKFIFIGYHWYRLKQFIYRLITRVNGG